MKKSLDLAFLLAAVAIAALFTTRYLMPFRLDDILLMDWSMKHRLLDVFDPVGGQLINSFRPMYALTAYVLTHLAGWSHPFWWHLTLTVSLLTGLAFVGMTARYLADRWFALQISIALYWLAFTAILNVFFWYSDLTYGLELAFTAPAWYFGIRGLYEARLKFWLLAMVLGCLAILSKEPAFVLVHLVLAGSFAMERHQILMAWKAKPMGERVTALAGYALLLVVTCFIIFVSPTRGNRFFSLSTPDFGHFIRDRVDYYSAIYLSIGARLLLFFPIVYVAGSSLITWRSERRSVPVLLFITVLAAVCSMLLFRNILIALPLLVLALAALAVYPNREMWHVRRLLPFMACLLIASGTLLVTIQLVKTQLTEIAMLTIILSGWGWSVWVGDVRDALALAQNGARVRRLVMACVAVIVVLGIAGTMPRLVRQEHILRDVRDVRKNANDALAWSAQNLPPNSLFAVALYSLHGIERLDLVTSKDDETKVREQYTFDGGFVYYVFEVLGRRDIRHAYLADPELLPRVLTAMRAQPNSYLFLQSALDLQLFHGSSVRQPLIGMRDTLVARFGRGPYPCEVWMMRE